MSFNSRNSFEFSPIPEILKLRFLGKGSLAGVKIEPVPESSED